MHSKYNDTDLREALRRKYSDTPQLPADFMASMKQKMEQGSVPGGSSAGAGGKNTGSKRIRLWRWVAAAACLLIIIGIGVGYQFSDSPQPIAKSSVPDSTTECTRLPNRVHPIAQLSAPDSTTECTRLPNRVHPIAKTAHTNQETGAHQPDNRRAPTEQLTHTNQTTGAHRLIDSNIHYASHEAEDTVPYQAPSRVDDFINRIAEYNNVQAEPLQCSSDKGIDSSIVSKAYLFEDTKELDLFGRLLQVACWYNTKSPGYLLNFTRNQFVFCLEDRRMGQKYLWVAERLSGNHILLFSTHSPIETVVSSTCFQDYREQLTHKGINILQF